MTNISPAPKKKARTPKSGRASVLLVKFGLPSYANELAGYYSDSMALEQLTGINLTRAFIPTQFHAQRCEMQVYVSDVQLAARYGVSRSTIWRWVASGRLPSPVALSPGTTRWLVSEIEARDAEMLAARESAA